MLDLDSLSVVNTQLLALRKDILVLVAIYIIAIMPLNTIAAVLLSILILGCLDPFELGLNLAWCNVVRGIMLNGRTIRVCLSMV